MKKITSYQIAPEYKTSPLEYNDVLDHVYVFGNSNLIGIRADEIDRIRESLEDIADTFDDLQHGNKRNEHDDISNALYYNFRRDFTRAERLKMISAAVKYDREPRTTTAAALRAVCDALEILHGMPFDWHMIRGCSQSAWQYFICPDAYGKEYRDEIECEYFNTGDEWNVNVDGCECTVYTHSWRDDEKRQEIADAVGCDPSDVILYAFDGYTQTPKYREV